VTPDALREWRWRRGLSRQDAAPLLGIPWKTIETLETRPRPNSPLWGPIARIVELMNKKPPHAAE